MFHKRLPLSLLQQGELLKALGVAILMSPHMQFLLAFAVFILLRLAGLILGKAVSVTGSEHLLEDHAWEEADGAKTSFLLLVTK